MALLVTLMPWRHALRLVSVLGGGVAVAIAVLLPSLARVAAVAREPSGGRRRGAGTGFGLLLTIGVPDTAVRMGLLTFLPFLLEAKGASTPLIGTALALVFIGGAAGKFVCGWLGSRVGVTGTVFATEGGTAALILAVMAAPLSRALVLLPLLGVMLNGTSSVLYGTVPELSHPDGLERAFALFYTGTIGAGAIAPVLYGLLGDRVGVRGATFATALTALAIVPLAIALRPHLPSIRGAPALRLLARRMTSLRPRR
jgi:MFS family permease